MGTNHGYVLQRGYEGVDTYTVTTMGGGKRVRAADTPINQSVMESWGGISLYLLFF